MRGLVMWQRYWTPACFVCGLHNGDGLRATVVGRGPAAWVMVTVPSAFMGMPHTLHGGVVAALLDEAMWYAVFGAGHLTVTSSLQLRFVRPAAPGEPVLAAAAAEETGASDGRPARVVRASATLLDASGRLLAAARGSFTRAERVQEVHRLIGSGPAEEATVRSIESWPARRGRQAAGPYSQREEGITDGA